MTILLRKIPLALASLSLLLLSACNGSQPSPDVYVGCDAQELIAAIDDANADDDLTRIHLPAGCTFEFSQPDNTDGGHQGNALPAITSAVAIDGQGATLSRLGPIQFRFFFITGQGNLRLLNATLTGGYSIATTGETEPGGGAIYNDGGSLWLSDVLFLSNHNLADGGAIYNHGHLVIQRGTRFETNAAHRGGAIFNASDQFLLVVIQGATFVENIATEGGAIYSQGARSSVTITQSTFEANVGWHGGGAIASMGGELEVGSSQFTQNQSGQFGIDYANGGAIYAMGSSLSLRSCAFIEQTAYGQGGAVYAGEATTLVLDRGRLSDNFACRGAGGLYSAGEATVLRSTFDTNIGGSGSPLYRLSTDGTYPCDDFSGGAISNYGTLRLSYSTLVDNFAELDGASLFNQGTLTAFNTTFFNRGGSAGEDIYNEGVASLSSCTAVLNQIVNHGDLTIKNSIVDNYGQQESCLDLSPISVLGDNMSSDASCGFNLVVDDPGYGVFGDHGGPTYTLPLVGGNPAINAVTDCTTVEGAAISDDQRGVSRLGGGACDIGAYELYGLIEPPLPTAGPPTEPPLTPPMAFAPQDSTCREGPDRLYAAAGYLMLGESAEVVGQSQDGNWLVIANPDWSGRCFIARTLVEVTGQTEDLPVFAAPPLPTLTPEPAGCLVGRLTSAGFDCVVPCPSGADPGTPCNP